MVATLRKRDCVWPRKDAQTQEERAGTDCCVLHVPFDVVLSGSVASLTLACACVLLPMSRLHSHLSQNKRENSQHFPRQFRTEQEDAASGLALVKHKDLSNDHGRPCEGRPFAYFL